MILPIRGCRTAPEDTTITMRNEMNLHRVILLEEHIEAMPGKTVISAINFMY